MRAESIAFLLSLEAFFLTNFPLFSNLIYAFEKRERDWRYIALFLKLKGLGSRMKVDKVNIVKKILESPHEVESELKILDKDVNIADYGSIDMVGMDGSKRLVLIEIGLDESPQILLDALGRFDWLVRNEGIVRRLYASSDVDWSKPPRVFVMVPHLSDSFLRIVSHLSRLDLHLFEYSYVPSLDGLVVQTANRERFEPAGREAKSVTQVLAPLYARLKEVLHESFERLEIFEIGPVSLLTSDDRILARVSLTGDVLIIDMPPDGILEVKDRSDLENVVSVLGARAQKLGLAPENRPKDNPAGNPSSLAPLTEQELEALGGTGEKKIPDAPYLAEAETE